MIKSFSTLSKLFLSFFAVMGVFLIRPITASAVEWEDVPPDCQIMFELLCQHYNLDTNKLGTDYDFFYYETLTMNNTTTYTCTIIDIAGTDFQFVPNSGNYPSSFYIQLSDRNAHFYTLNEYFVGNFSYGKDINYTYLAPNTNKGQTFPMYLYGNFPAEQITNLTQYGLYITYEGGTSESEVESSSDLGLFSAFYNITFTPLYASSDDTYVQSCIGNIYPCYLTDVSSDNGYTMLALQCGALAKHQDVVFYGEYHFNLRKQSSYLLDDMSLSFATDVPYEPDDSDFFIPSSSFFKVGLLDNPPDGTDLTRSVPFTVSKLSFLNASNKVVSYNSREMIAFDYKTDTSVYPYITFWACCNANMYSAGSFVYNFDYSDITNGGTSLTPDEIDDLEDEGESENDDTRQKTVYIPKYVEYPSDRVTFDDPSIPDYDFATLGDVFRKLFNDYIIEMMIACASIGLLGYVLFGRRA